MLALPDGRRIITRASQEYKERKARLNNVQPQHDAHVWAYRVSQQRPVFKPQKIRRSSKPSWKNYLDACHEIARRENAYIDQWLREQKEETRKRITAPAAARQIIEYVSLVYGFDASQVTGPLRTKALVVARHIAIYLVHIKTDRSVGTLKWIARRFSGRDHTTILHAIKKTARRRAVDPVFDALITDYETEIAKLEKSCAS